MPCDEKDVTLRYEGGGGFDVDQIAKAIQTKMTPDRVKARDDNLLKARIDTAEIIYWLTNEAWK